MKPRKRFIIFALALLFVSSAAIAIFYRISSVPTGAARPTSKDLMDFVVRHNLRPAGEIQQATAQNNAPESISPTSRVRLAIGWLGLPDEESNQRVSDLITADLSAAKNLELVDRQSLDALLHEQQMSLSGVIRANSAIRLGKLLRADWFLLGTATVIHGSNYVVERIVDARTGQWQDSQAFPVESDPFQMAANLSAFVRQCRTDASHARPKTYLVIGDFQDASEKGRHLEFQQQLSSSFTAAFRDDTNVTMLERENVDALTQEFRLDLAGLTGESATNSSAPLQSAYWTVDGFFQFSEAHEGEVQLYLSVWQVFNSLCETNLIGPPGEAIARQFKETVAAHLAEAGPFVRPPTRRGEISLQMKTGKKLSGIDVNTVGNVGYVRDSHFLQFDKEDKEKRTFDLQGAIRAFKTVLLLDPDNQEAKMYLANCLWHPYINQQDEAFNYFREVGEADPVLIESSLELPVVGTVLLGIHPDPDFPLHVAQYRKGTALMAAALCHPDDPNAAEWVRRAQVLGPERSNYWGKVFGGIAAAKNPPTPEEEFTASTSALVKALENNRFYGAMPGVGNFLAHFKSDPEEGLKRLNAIMSTFEKQYPAAAPYMVLDAFTSQSKTNNPFLPDLLRSMARLSEHPDQVAKPDAYFETLSSSGLAWAFSKGQYSLVEQIVQAKQKASVISNSLSLTVAEKLSLAYAYKGLEHWQDALAIFTNLPPSPIDPVEPGPWEHWTEAYLPGPDINYCLERLGLPKDPNLVNPVDRNVNFFQPFTFTCSEGSVWAAVGSTLYQLDYNLHTNGIFVLPIDSGAAALYATPSRLWIGTSGSGLVEFNTETHESTVINERDGLLRDGISSLCLQTNTLWIGYPIKWNDPVHYEGGGISQLDLPTRRISSFGGTASHFQPTNWLPKVPTNLISGANGEVFLPTFPILQGPKFPKGTPLQYNQVVHVGDLLVAAYFGPNTLTLVGTNAVWNANSGLATKNEDGPWETLGAAANLPRPIVNSLQWDGRDLWLGGWGYVAVMDLGKMTVRQTIFIHQNVTHLELAGGYAWIRGGSGGGWHDTAVFRIPLSVAK